MATFKFLGLLASAFAATVLCTPAPHIGFSSSDNNTSAAQRYIKITQTITMTSTSFITVTFFSPGTSHFQPSATIPAPFPITTAPKPTIPASPTTSNEPDYNGSTYYVDGVGDFKNKKVFTFNSDKLPDGLQASEYTVYDSYGGAPYNHKFDPANVYCDGKFLNLRVPADPSPPAGQDHTISCAEVVTTQNDIKYASVRMNAIFSEVPGTCHGMFFYLDDTQEIDIEYLTDRNSTSNIIGPSSSDASPIPLWYSNQAIKSGQKATQATGPPPSDVASIHEYRIDWVEDYTAFYVDGKLQKKYTTNVPTKAGSWIWNNWANGDQGWSLGPPKQDNIMKIENITMYYNTTSDGKNT